jgi:multidrug resistance efflux pump
MSVVRFSVSLVAIIGLMAATIAGATIWLLLTDPVRTADAATDLAQGNVSPFVEAIGSVLYGALQGLFKYL